MARPRKHDRPKVVKAVCAAIAGGMLVKEACGEAGVTPKALREWCGADVELGTLYARAREEQAHAIAEEAIQIADGTDDEAQARLDAMAGAIKGAADDDKDRILNSLAQAAVQRDRLRIDSRKWLASKIAPRAYGEKLELAGSGGGAIRIRVVREDAPQDD